MMIEFLDLDLGVKANLTWSIFRFNARGKSESKPIREQLGPPSTAEQSSGWLTPWLGDF